MSLAFIGHFMYLMGWVLVISFFGAIIIEALILPYVHNEPRGWEAKLLAWGIILLVLGWVIRYFTGAVPLI